MFYCTIVKKTLHFFIFKHWTIELLFWNKKHMKTVKLPTLLVISLGRWFAHVLFPNADDKRLKQMQMWVYVHQHLLRCWKHRNMSCSQFCVSLWKTVQLTRFTFIDIWLRYKWEIPLWSTFKMSREIYDLRVTLTSELSQSLELSRWCHRREKSNESSEIKAMIPNGILGRKALSDRSETCMRTRWVTEKLMCCERRRSHFSIKRVDRFIGKGIRWCICAEKTYINSHACPGWFMPCNW